MSQFKLILFGSAKNEAFHFLNTNKYPIYESSHLLFQIQGTQTPVVRCCLKKCKIKDENFNAAILGGCNSLLSGGCTYVLSAYTQMYKYTYNILFLYFFMFF